MGLKNLGIFCIYILILFPWAHNASANVFVKDDRQALALEELDPRGAIGKLTNLRSFRQSTAFAVTPCHIITNYHAAIGRQADDVLNFPRSHVQLISGESSEAKVIDHGDYSSANKKDEDWAFLQLDNCIAEKFFKKNSPRLYLTSMSGRELKMSNFNFSMAGFPGDKDGRSLIEDPLCSIHETDGRHDCASRAGNSGSPIYFKTDQGSIAVVAFHSEAKGSFPEIIRSYSPEIANDAVLVSQLPNRVLQFIDRELQKIK